VQFPQKPQQVVDLLFGCEIGGRIGVTEAQWQASSIARSRRFPDYKALFSGYREEVRISRGNGLAGLS